jgi:hypothetical protein
MTKPYIKRTITVILAANMVLSLPAYTKSGPAASSGSAPSAVTSSAEATLVAVDNVTFRAEDGTIILNSTHIKSVKPTKSDGENYSVLITFTKDGAEILAASTANMLEQAMSLYIYDEQVFSAELTTAIYDGELLIGGNYTKEKADSMAESINAGLKGEAPPTEEPAEIPQGTIAPGDFPEGWNEITATVSIADFSEKITEIDPAFAYVENPLNYQGGTALTQWGWSNGTVAVAPYVVATLDPPAWGVTFGTNGEMDSAAIVVYENLHRTFFWLDEEADTMSAPLACALWLAAEGTLNTTTLAERRGAWEEVREFVKTVSIMASRAGYEMP